LRPPDAELEFGLLGVKDRGAGGVKTTLTVERDAQAPWKARQAIADLVPEVDERLVPNAKLLISELITNSVKYGQGPIELRFEAPEPSVLRCEVIDAGAGFTPVALSRPSTEVGGWGLHMVETLAESWGVHDGSTHVWFQLSVDE